MAKVTKRLRYEILRRDGFRCRYCGATPAEAELRIDHVIPEALGGPSVPSNLATACHPCNSGKSSVPPEAPIVEQVADDALRWSAAMERAASEMEARLRKRDDQNLVFLNEWTAYTYGGSAEQTVQLDPNWSTSVTRLRTAGLTDPLIVEAVKATMGANRVLPENRFRYFCGVAWNMVSEMQANAQQIAAGTQGDGDGDAGEPDDLQYPGVPHSELDGHLWRYQSTCEELIRKLPSWLFERAYADAIHDWTCAGHPDASRLLMLPDILRHLGGTLSDCRIAAEGDA